MLVERLATLGRWQRLLLACLCGALMAAGHAPLDLPWIWFIALPLFALLVQAAPGNAAAGWTGWAAGIGYFAAGLHWIFHPFLVRAQSGDGLWLMWTSGGVAAVIGMGAGLAIFWGIAAWAARRLAPSGITGAAALAATLTAVEIARTHVLTGFPWALPGYIWVETPVMQTAAWAGPHGMTLLTLLICGLPGASLAWRHARITTCAVAAALFALSWVAGTARLGTDIPTAADSPLLRIVQPNAPQHLKWLPGHRETFYQRTVDATAAPRADGPLDAVIWPETAMYFLPENVPQETVRLGRLAEAPLIVGALAVEGLAGSETWFNALFVFNPDGSTAVRYDKHHLVPFGEYIPFPWLTDLLGLRKFGIGGGFGRGPGPETIEIPGLPGFSALICYEAIFPHNVIGDGPRPDWMLQVTNDAWFGDFAGPQQHLAQARIRAIEQGLPMVRAANTGISAVIDARGTITRSLPLGEYGYFDARLPAALPPTVYARTGDWPAYAMVLLILALVIGLRVRTA